MNNNLRTTSDNFQNTLHPQHHNIYPESHSTSGNKTNNGFYSKETFIVGSSRNRNQTTFKHEPLHMPSPTEKNNSFSDIISPHNVQTVVDMSLEKELENNNQKSLNTMSNRSKYHYFNISFEIYPSSKVCLMNLQLKKKTKDQKTPVDLK